MAIETLYEGTVAPGYITISLSSSTPAFSCAGLDAGLFSHSGILYGAVQILVEKSAPIAAGTIAITDQTTYDDAQTGLPDGGLAAGLAWVVLGDATNPPSNQTKFDTESVSGSLTLTKVGTEWAGSFTATMTSPTDGGSNPLSGTFDTSNICER